MLKKIYHIDAADGAATEMYEIDAREALAKFPKEWSETPWPAKKNVPEEPKDLKPADDPKAPFEAREKGKGWWAIFDATGAEVGKSIREPDGVAFNSKSDDEKDEYVKLHTKED
ncbi:hypothetical protein GYN07_20985 [Rhizobium leguminosarum bv. viciae 248]|uniref:hypothetical protein n=1 Tax=Rhizobium leguminosarum TaxID=384 RepID=UPI000370DCDF|nr:hypothetical protein [Rhizobium leguminosarum]QHW26657.1 hypothetical protein GYN07_20985 [Rhizobium leguminosarum bv. viciae 248]